MSAPVPGFSKERSISAVFFLGLALTVCAAWNRSQAQLSLQVLHSHVPTAVSNGRAAPVGSLPTEQNMSISIVLPLRNQSALTSLLGRLYDPSSPDYRHFVTVQQFTDQFGPTVEDYQAVVSFAPSMCTRNTDSTAASISP
jgi:subtilase family serine protease